MDERFALIREPEAEALKRLSGNAAKALIAVKFGRRDGDAIAFGVRDLEAWGMSRAGAGRALAELVSAGLFEVVEDSAFGAKRRRRVLRAVHAREKTGLQSRGRDTGEAHSLTGETMGGATVSPVRLSAPLQSHRRDTPRTSLLPSGQEGREGGKEGAADPAPTSAGPPPGRRKPGRGMRGAAELAGRLQLPLVRLIERAGGTSSRACDLADQVQSGEVSLDQARNALGLASAGSARGREPPGVFTIPTVRAC